jgi:hypothetical protein
MPTVILSLGRNNTLALLGLPVERVVATPGAVFVKFHALWIIAPVFLGCIVALAALGTFQGDDCPNVLLSHN